MMYWLREAGLCWGGLIFLEELERGEGSLVGLSWVERATEQGGRE